MNKGLLSVVTPAGEDALKFGKPSKTIKLLLTINFAAKAPAGDNGGFPKRNQAVEGFIVVASGERLDTIEFARFLSNVLFPKVIRETIQPSDDKVYAVEWAIAE